MLSMEPSIKRGLTQWDRALMPHDEFDERLAAVRSEMKRQGLSALIVYGNMYEDADLVYLVSYNVDGTMILPLDGEPAIFTNSGSREGYFLKQLTWIDDLAHKGPLVGKATVELLRQRGTAGGRIGIVGLQAMPARAHQDLVGALSGYEPVDFNPAMRAIRSRVRPRELAATRIALGMARKAAEAAERVFAAGGSTAAAVVEAERVARVAGAWDFRALANIDSDGLRPFERMSDARRTPFLLWVATRHQGYWADCAATSSAPAGSEAAKAVAAMTAAARSGATAGAVAEAGLAHLGEAARKAALAYGLGQGIGGELNAPPKIAPGNAETLTDGALLSFRICALGSKPSLAAALVQVGPKGGEPLQAR